jgi:hypothetical protein
VRSARETATDRTRWKLVYALAALQLVVTLGWMIYASFQASLLERFGFASFEGLLSLYLGLAGATLAPLVGGIGDRIAGRGGHRFPLVVAGGLLAGATFVAVAATVAAQPLGALRWLLLGLVLLWIAAMTILQAPVLSLLPSASRSDRWPVVVSPLVVATVLPTVLWPAARGALERLGGPTAFLAGGALVLAATFALRGAFQAPDVALASAPGASPLERVGTERSGRAFVGIIFAVGIASAFVTRLASDVVPAILASRLGSGGSTLALLSATTLGAATLLAPSLGALGAAVGSPRSLVWSLVVAVICGSLAPLCSSIASAGAVSVVLGAALALHLDSALPFSLGSLSLDRAGLSAGLYLGGVFAGSQLAVLAVGS